MRTGGMHRHSSPQKPGRCIPIDAFVDFQQGVHSQWFYVKGDAAAPLPAFSGRIIEELPGLWKWGVPVKEKKNIQVLLAALQILKERGVKGSGIIGAYHTWRVAPLMSRALPLYLMVPGVSPEGTALSDEALPHQSGIADQGGDGAFKGHRRRCP